LPHLMRRCRHADVIDTASTSDDEDCWGLAVLEAGLTPDGATQLDVFCIPLLRMIWNRRGPPYLTISLVLVCHDADARADSRVGPRFIPADWWSESDEPSCVRSSSVFMAL
jgi:hypothetical protein